MNFVYLTHLQFRCVSRVIQIASPQSAEFRSNLEGVLGRVGRHDQAAAELQQAVRIKPDCADGWCNLGVALEKSNKIKEAEAAFWRAIELKPTSAPAHHFLGNAYEDIAVRLTGGLGRLEKLRHALRGRLMASPIADAAGFAQRLGQAYPSIWERWRAGANAGVSVSA